MEHRKINEQDEKITEGDIEALERKPFLVTATKSGGTMINRLNFRKCFVIVALTVLTSSQAIFIVWSKRAGNYEYSVTTANFSVEALKCALSLLALFKIWRRDGLTQDNKTCVTPGATLEPGLNNLPFCGDGNQEIVGGVRTATLMKPPLWDSKVGPLWDSRVAGMCDACPTSVCQIFVYENIGFIV